MPKKRKPARKAGPMCPICSEPMQLKMTIPKAHIFAELKTFQCGECGNLRTVEDEIELAAPEAVCTAA